MTNYLTPTTIALGKFDGLHRGHLRVIQSIFNFATPQVSDKQIQSSSIFDIKDKTLVIQKSEQEYTECIYQAHHSHDNNYYPTVVTFNPYPYEFFTGNRRPLLTPLNEKVQQLLCLGVKQVVPLIFNQKLATLSPQEFVEKILVQQLQAQHISVGEDFRFGHRCSGNATDLKAIAAIYNISVSIIPNYTHKGHRISSAAIRQALEQGELETVHTLLGRCYTLTGFVIKSRELNKVGSFMNVKLQLPPNKLLPPVGVYVVTVFVKYDREQEWGSDILQNIICEHSLLPAFKGIMNISYPELGGTQASVDIDILDCVGNLNGKTLIVELESCLEKLDSHENQILSQPLNFSFA